MASKKHRKKLKHQHIVRKHWEWVESTNPYARMLNNIVPIKGKKYKPNEL